MSGLCIAPHLPRELHAQGTTAVLDGVRAKGRIFYISDFSLSHATRPHPTCVRLANSRAPSQVGFGLRGKSPRLNWRRSCPTSATSASSNVGLRTSVEPKIKEGNWFFGYGATLNENVIKNRKLSPLEASPGRLDEYRLVFDVGHMGDGAAFASVRAATGDACVHGMLYYFSEEDFTAMMRSENAIAPPKGTEDNRTYVPKLVKVTKYDGGTVQAYTLVNIKAIRAMQAGGDEKDKMEYKPSWRYLAVICEGARRNKLDKAYTADLAALEYIKGPAKKAVQEIEPSAKKFTLKKLAQYNGDYSQAMTVKRNGQTFTAQRTPSPVYVAFRGKVFDASISREAYRSGFLGGLAGQDITKHMMTFAYVPSVDVDGSVLEVDETDGMNAMQRDLLDSIEGVMTIRNKFVGVLVDE